MATEEKVSGSTGQQEGDETAESEFPVFVCRHVFGHAAQVLLVIHNNNDDWQLLCGQDHSQDRDPAVIGINHLLERDPSLTDVADLPAGWEAERAAPGGVWKRAQIEVDE